MIHILHYYVNAKILNELTFHQNLEKLRMLRTLNLAENEIDKIGNDIIISFLIFLEFFYKYPENLSIILTIFVNVF